MRKKLTLPVLLLLSAVGLALQYWNQTVGYDALSLPIPGALSGLVTKLFAAVCVIAAFWLASSLSGVTLKHADGLYRTLSTPGTVVGILAGALTAVGGAGKLSGTLIPMLRWKQTTGAFNCLIDALLICAGGAMLWMTLTPRRAPKSGPALAPLIPGFAGCFWLAVFYHANSQDAVVSHYGWILVGQMAFILACYYQAGYSFDRCRPFLAQLFTCLSAPLLFMALPTAQTRADLALLAGFGAWMLLGAVQIHKVSHTKGAREA